MAGIRITASDDTTRLYPVIWVDPNEVPTFFILVKTEGTGLAHPDYIADLLHQMDIGDLDPANAWDDLLVQTPALPYPQKCTVRRLTGTGGGAEIRVGASIVHRFS